MVGLAVLNPVLVERMLLGELEPRLDAVLGEHAADDVGDRQLSEDAAVAAHAEQPQPGPGWKE